MKGGHVLIAKGGEVDQYIIDKLIKLGIMTVYIQVGEEEPETDESQISTEARKNIEKYRKDDRANVKLSSSVRKRVAEGIAGLLHDLGKSKILFDILNKPGRLTKEEISKEVQLSVLQHHEKINCANIIIK